MKQDAEEMKTIRRIIVMLFILVMLFPVFGKDIIASATLHITLYVPPAPITYETAPGEYSGYEVERVDDHTIYIVAE